GPQGAPDVAGHRGGPDREDGQVHDPQGDPQGAEAPGRGGGLLAGGQVDGRGPAQGGQGGGGGGQGAGGGQQGAAEVPRLAGGEPEGRHRHPAGAVAGAGQAGEDRAGAPAAAPAPRPAGRRPAAGDRRAGEDPPRDLAAQGRGRRPAPGREG